MRKSLFFLLNLFNIEFFIEFLLNFPILSHKFYKFHLNSSQFSVTQSVSSYFEIISQSTVKEIDYRNFTTSSELYGVKLDFLMTTLTEVLYKQGYAPFKTGLIFQKRYVKAGCQFNDVLKYDYGLCVDTRAKDEGAINDNSSKEENNYRSAFGLEGSAKEKKY